MAHRDCGKIVRVAWRFSTSCSDLRCPLPTKERNVSAPWPAFPIFGLDALSSAAYGPEAALTLLIPLGAAGVAYILPISISIIVLLTIVFFSYRQTIETYPGGGGSYTVARHNLGVFPGPAGRGCVDDRLHPGRGGRHLGGRGCAGFRRARLEPHTLMLCLGDSRRGYHGQLTRRARNGRGVLSPHLLICRHSVDRHRHWV